MLIGETHSWDISPKEGIEIGAVLRTKSGVKPLFVSPGHLVDMRGSVDLVLKCSKNCRLPEPTGRHTF